ncbi:MAG TPA: hypothetical protein VHD83_15330 [Puia sp.]|nr:hypothetical protein [Puia sp.]
MQKIALISLMVLAMACHSIKHATTTPSGTEQSSSGSGQDGSSYENAIVIQEKHEGAGVDAEYKWVREHYPGSKSKGQGLTYKNGKPYDILTIQTADGTEKKVYFDISNFFGKF